MGQKKLLRFEAIGNFANVLQYPKGMPGKWNKFFKNENPITLELACGKGEYTVGLAALYPDRNFIGVDLKGNRIYTGALESLKNNYRNAAFLRTHIDKIDSYFLPAEVSEIWITFPDPQLRTSRAKKRLTHPRFLRLYQNILKPGGFIHLKTDSPEFYYFTMLVADLYGVNISDSSEDIYARPENPAEIYIKTHYEKLDIAASNKIYYIKLNLPEKQIPIPDLKFQQLLKEIENTVQS
ncbi:MAG TPA: tRNA (guanosine(46)-N7)-methyltransferase TrmB [Puia sp.]|nr:tRNA (guanosine(46)-N7)-methyltransferase TrmB [Puia sp.]